MRRTSTGLFALATLGSYFLYRNRRQIAKFLESRGMNMPWTKGNLVEDVQSGIEKAKGKILHTVDQVDQNSRKAV
jgi:hypothetical protein